MQHTGAKLAWLLMGGFRTLVDAATDELARRGYPDFRPVHEFAMRAIAAGADNASQLGRSLSVSKQAAAKTIAVLQERGYVIRESDPRDGRLKRLAVTELGYDVLRQGESIFDELRERWARQIGRDTLEALEAQLATFVGDSPGTLDLPGWMGGDTESADQGGADSAAGPARPTTP